MKISQFPAPQLVKTSQFSVADSFNPETLFSGYNLAGGDTPGQDLDAKRNEYILRSLHKHHMQAVVAGTGDVVLRRKRAPAAPDPSAVLRAKTASRRRLSLLHQRLASAAGAASTRRDSDSTPPSSRDGSAARPRVARGDATEARHAQARAAMGGPVKEAGAEAEGGRRVGSGGRAEAGSGGLAEAGSGGRAEAGSGGRAEAGFLAALKASRANPYKAAMTGTVFQHFLRLRQAEEAKEERRHGKGEAKEEEAEEAKERRRKA